VPRGAAYTLRTFHVSRASTAGAGAVAGTLADMIRTGYAVAMPGSPTPCYGDYPKAFWDADPRAPIDADSPVVLARALTRGTAELVGQLITPDDLLTRLDTLPIPEHVRAFWRAVVEPWRPPSEPGTLPTMEIPRRPDSSYRAELALLRARHKTVGPEWSFEDIRVLLDVAAGVEPGLAAWIEEIALRIERELATDEAGR